MIGLALALSVALNPIPMPPLTPHGVPTSGTASWYGSTSGYKTHCYDGYRNTCTPYSKGEQVWYAAVGSWHYHDKPYNLEVCRRGTTKCVVVVVRDYCHGAWKSLKKPWSSRSRAIDLSPAAFLQIAGRLSLGVVYVTIREIPAWRPNDRGL